MDKLKGGALAVFLTGGLALFYYADIIFNAGSFVLGASGDGYKNYYTIAYYLRYNTGTHFTGMNYPFGENVIFTDNQPALSWMLKPIANFFPGITYHIHSLLLLVFCLSLLLSAFLIYKILESFKLHWLYAAVASLFIIMLAPQIPRAGGHFALSYVVFIPALLYLLIQFLNNQHKNKYPIALAVVMCLGGFIQLYYAAMGALFIMLVSIVYAINRYKKHIPFKASVAKLLAVTLLPFVLMKLYLLLTDPVTDRPSLPWGFVLSRSTIADIFLHPYSFTGRLLAAYFPGLGIVYHSEGSGYIGLVTIIILIASFIIYIKGTKPLSEIFEDIYPLNLFILPAAIVLFFAMAFPFNINPVEKYYIMLPTAVKQFRASGRFNWVFYYNATILAAVVGYRWLAFMHTQSKSGAYILAIFFMAIGLIEIDMISRGTNRNLVRSGGNLDEEMLQQHLAASFQKAGIKPENFQAIMPLPIFLTGSEKLYIDGGSIATDAMEASLFTGLPLVATQMSRTSQFQTFEIANLLSNTPIKKDVLRFCNQKPFLVLTDGNRLNEAENNLLCKAQFLFETGNNKYYRLPLSAFSDSVESIKEYCQLHKPELISHNTYLSNSRLDNVVIKEFENETLSDAVFRKGAHFSNDTPAMFYNSTLPNAIDNTVYELSFWTYTDPRRAAYPLIYYVQTDSTSKKIDGAVCDPKFSTNIYNNWVRGSIKFTLRSHSNKITITGEGDYATFDEIMIRPENVNVITRYRNDAGFIFNNYPIN